MANPSRIDYKHVGFLCYTRFTVELLGIDHQGSQAADDDSTIFGILIQWLYSNSWQDLPYLTVYQYPEITLFDLVRLYCLADKLIIPRLRFAVMDRLRSIGAQKLYQRDGFTPDLVHYAYEHTLPTSMLRVLIADTMTVGVFAGLVDLDGKDNDFKACDCHNSRWSGFFGSGGEAVRQVIKRLRVGEAAFRTRIESSKYIDADFQHLVDWRW